MKPTRPEVTTIMLPLTTDHRAKAGEIFREMRRRDPRTVGEEKVFLAIMFGGMVEQLHTQLFPKMIQEAGVILPPNTPITGSTQLPEWRNRPKGVLDR